MQIKNRQKFLLIVTIAALGLLAGDSLILEPLIKSWGDREKQIADLTKKINDGNRLIGSQSVINRQWTRMQRGAFLRASAENEMLKNFDRWAQNSGRITVNSIKPQPKQTEDDFMTLVCRADATGNMDSLARFLYEVEHDSSSALRVEAVEISTHDNDGTQLTLGLQVSGLILNP